MFRNISIVGAAALAVLSLLPDSAFAQRRRFTVPVYYPVAPVYYTYTPYNPVYTPRVVVAQPAPAEMLPQVSTSVRPVAVFNMRIGDNAFEPHSIRVPVGSTLRWVNYGRHVHTVSSNDDFWDWDSGDLPPGRAFSVTFDQPGTYRYHCKHHPGMEGTIIVGSGVAPPRENGTNGRSY